MAKRLNKKVAIIGSLILALLMVAAIVVVLRLSRDPQKHIADAEAALALAEPDYKTAEKAYGRAFAYTKNMDGRIDILFKLARMYIDNKEWPKAAGCWNRIINYDTKNIKARLALLDYVYQVADAGNWAVWKDVESDASELIDKELDTSPRMYNIKGRALLELVRHGQVTDKESGIKETIEILQKVNHDKPNDVNTYWYLADAIMQQGEILAAKGVLDATSNAHQEAVKVLNKGVENLPDEPRAYTNLYSSRLSEAAANPDKYKELESDVVKLTEKFSDNALPYFTLVQLYGTNPKDIDKAIAAIKKAIELDKQNVNYAVTAASLYYRMYSINKNDDDFQKAIDIANEALKYPASLDERGPRERISFINRYTLHTFLADCFVERATDTPAEQPEKSKWLEKAENEIYQIGQLLGIAENPYVIMWQGRLLFAKGQKNEAIVKMYAAYEALTASGLDQRDAQLAKLSYELAEALRDSSETGAVIRFYSTAVRNRLYYAKPEVILDFASSLAYLKLWPQVLEMVNGYEASFPKNERSTILRIGSYIGQNMFEQAQEMLDKLSIEDPNVLRLKIALLNNKLAQIGRQDVNIVEQPLPQAPQSGEQLKAQRDVMTKERDGLRNKLALLGAANVNEQETTDICRKYLSDGQIDKAKKFADDFLTEHPSSVTVRIYRLELDEPAPANVPPERVDELTVKAIESLNEPVKKTVYLGQFYQSKGQKDKAVGWYQQGLKLEPNNASAIAGLFDIAVSNNDFEQAEKLSDIARQNNIDMCEGEYFKARLAFAKKEYQTAIDKVTICLEKRPIFSQAYMLRGQANMMLGKESDAIDDTKNAYSLNPLDSFITKNFAVLLYNRNRKLGVNASTDQINEFKAVLTDAIRANPTDVSLRGFYAEYVGDTDPQMAIAICQQIQKSRPNVENALVLGRIALKASEQSIAETQKKIYFSIAENAYKDAFKLAPADKRVLQAYSEFLKASGKTDEAEKMLAGREDLLWRSYIRSGKLDEAQQLLKKLYEANPDDINTIRGLILVSRSKNDQAETVKYINQLLKADNSLDNQIVEVETYIEMGLVDDARTKLDSLSERYPDEPRAMFLQAWFLGRQGKVEEAIKLADKNLEIDKDNPRAWQLRGQLNLALNKLNQAIDDLQKSKAIEDNPEVRIDLARAYIRTNKGEEAIAELETAADEQGSIAARTMLEEAYMITGKSDRLEKFYNKMIEKNPDSLYWYDQAGELALSRNEFETAYKLFDTAFQNSLKVSSESPDGQAFEGRLRVLLGTKKYDQLFTEASKYLEGPMAATAYARMAEAKAQTGDKNTAVQYFRKAIEKAGTNEALMVNIIRYMAQVVGIDETMKWCNERLQSQPDSIAVNFAMYNLYRMTGDPNRTIEYLDNCIRIAKDNEQLVLGYRVDKAGILYETYIKTADKTYLKQTIKEYESILQKQPTNVSVLNNIAYMLADTDMDISKALEYAERAYKAASNSSEVLDTYGYVLFKNGKIQQADEILQRALQQYEQNKINAPIDVYEHIGWVKEKLGQDAEALQSYKRAMEVAGKNVSQEVKNRISAEIERMSLKQQ